MAHTHNKLRQQKAWAWFSLSEKVYAAFMKGQGDTLEDIDQGLNTDNVNVNVLQVLGWDSCLHCLLMSRLDESIQNLKELKTVFPQLEHKENCML